MKERFWAPATGGSGKMKLQKKGKGHQNEKFLLARNKGIDNCMQNYE